MWTATVVIRGLRVIRWQILFFIFYKSFSLTFFLEVKKLTGMPDQNSVDKVHIGGNC